MSGAATGQQPDEILGRNNNSRVLSMAAAHNEARKLWRVPDY
jgi:hypothetical protein